MPGFIDTHHHQFETALRSFLADGVLINDGTGSPSGSVTYFEFILLKFAPVYRPQDVYINELFARLHLRQGEYSKGPVPPQLRRVRDAVSRPPRASAIAGAWTGARD